MFFFRQYYGKPEQTIIISGLILTLTLAYVFVTMSNLYNNHRIIIKLHFLKHFSLSVV